MFGKALKHCLCVVNTRSGARAAPTLLAQSVGHALATHGVTHTTVTVPQEPLLPALRALAPRADLIVVAGGDGTVSSVVNALSAPGGACWAPAGAHAGEEAAPLPAPPLLVVPAGRHNSVAASLGLSSAARAVAALGRWRAAPVPVWRASLDGRPLRYVVSYAAGGLFARVLARHHALGGVGEEYMSLPALADPFGLAVAAATLLPPRAPLPADLEWVCGSSSPHSGARDAPAEGRWEEGEGTWQRWSQPPHSAEPSAAAAPAPVPARPPPELVGWLAAQMPLQRADLSLTPAASHARGALSQVLVDASAGRLRELHLLRREGPAGRVLAEDGVHVHEGVAGARLRCRAAVPLFLDGERVEVPAGAVVELRRAEGRRTLDFLMG